MEVQGRTTSTPYLARVQSTNTASEIALEIELLTHPIKLKVTLKNTVEELKEKIRAEINADADEKITLRYESQTMEDDRTLASYKITEESVIYQAAKKTEEKSNKAINFGSEFNALTDEKKLKFAKIGPKYMYVTDGLNLRGTCGTKGCEAFNKVIWIQKGMNSFNICEEVYTSECPICKKSAEKIDNLGLFNCIYSIKGFQVAPEKKKMEKNDLVADDIDFTTFEQTGKLNHWASLTITTQPRKK